MKKILVAALALVLVMTASFAAADAIKIGVIGPLTGPYAQYGLAVEYGAKIAAEEISAKGDIQLEILAEDDQGDGELGVNAYNKLLDDGVCRVDFEVPQRAVTPGQSVVFYRGDVCLGGAIITKAE